MNPGLRHTLLNAAWLQAGWWGCVLGAQYPALLGAVLAGLAWHLYRCPARAEEVAALGKVGLAGCLLDSALGALGIFGFAQVPLPPWLALLWLVLASGLRHSLAWAARPGWRGALLGALAAPPAYLAGAALADVRLPLGAPLTGLLLAALWALWLPLSLRLARAG